MPTSAKTITRWFYSYIKTNSLYRLASIGIIPDNHPQEELRGLASIISSRDILKFVEDVEDGRALCLEGGEAADFVGQDQDPAKMDMDNITKADKDVKILTPEQEMELREAKEMVKKMINDKSKGKFKGRQDFDPSQS